MSVERLLILRLSALGDVAMTIPVIYSLAEQHPDVEITFVTRPFFARLLINAPANLRVFAADLKGRHRGARGLLRLMRELSALRPTSVADLHNLPRTWAIDTWFRMRGVKVRMVDKARSKRKKALRDKTEQKPFTERYRDVLAELGYDVRLTFKSLYKRVPAQPPVDPGSRAVGIAPFARYANKTYPPEMMRQVAAALAAEGIDVYLFGGGGKEAEELSGWEKDSPRIHCVAGTFAIEQELALMNRLQLMVSMDSANQHLASIAGTRVVSIWGSTAPECGFMPYGQSRENAMCHRIDCQPCSVAGTPQCPLGHMNCLREISPKEIVDKVLSNIS